LTAPFNVPPVTTTPAGEATAWGVAQVKATANFTTTWVATPVELSPTVTVPTEVVDVTMLQVITPVAETPAYAGVANAPTVRPLAINMVEMAMTIRRLIWFLPLFDIARLDVTTTTPPGS
jgi:hypothetical protein